MFSILQEDFHKMAQDNLVKISDISNPAPDKLNLSPAQVQEQKRLVRSFYKVRCSGDFLDFYGLVRDLCHMERLVNLRWPPQYLSAMSQSSRTFSTVMSRAPPTLTVKSLSPLSAT